MNDAVNKIFYVNIRGYSMISLMVDGKERVCLAQISNTLLKKYSYNEIHNRRVALGINCIQCTPMQLEILRSTGAMPISSRRCGMITKKEAERLVKSFLDDNKPPTLPDNFSFNVEHRCEYGCSGTFFPSRYNSSRAKCIRCNYCKLFFSPNKFIFHSHQLGPEHKKYAQSSATTINFNSWRKHIFLVNETNDELLNSAWEDVKSIFNSGKRKRVQSTPATGPREENTEEDDYDDELPPRADDDDDDYDESFAGAQTDTLTNQEPRANEQLIANSYPLNAQMAMASSLYLNFMTNILNPLYLANLKPDMFEAVANNTRIYDQDSRRRPTTTSVAFSIDSLMKERTKQTVENVTTGRSETQCNELDTKSTKNFMSIRSILE